MKGNYLFPILNGEDYPVVLALVWKVLVMQTMEPASKHYWKRWGRWAKMGWVRWMEWNAIEWIVNYDWFVL